MAANLRAKISLETSAFHSGIRSAQSAVSGFASKTTAIVGGIAAAFATVKVAKNVFRLLDIDDNLEKIGASLDNVKSKFSEMGLGLVTALSPTISAITKLLDSIDFEGVGQKIGAEIQTGINILVNAFKQGKLGELFSLSLQVGIGQAANFLIGAFSTALQAIAAILNRLFSQDFIASFIVALAGLGKKISAILIEAFTTPLAFMSAKFEELAVFLAKKIGGVLEMLGVKVSNLNDPFMNQTFDERLQGHTNMMSSTARGLNAEGDALFGESAAGLQNTAVDIANIIADTMKGFQPSDLFNTSEVEKKLVDLANRLKGNIGDTMEYTPWATDYDGQKGKGWKDDKTKGMEQDVDRFQRLGLFTGGASANSTISFQRNTADNTKTMVKQLGQLVKQGSTPRPAAAGALWNDYS